MSPAHIENHLTGASHLIGYAVAVGDAKPYNTALLVLDPDGAAGYAKAHGLADASPAALADNEGVLADLTAAVDAANRQMSRVEQIKKFTVVREDWLPDSDVLPPTMKLKRKPILARYAAEIDAMYAAE